MHDLLRRREVEADAEIVAAEAGRGDFQVSAAEGASLHELSL
jgi:hypothetical protein